MASTRLSISSGCRRWGLKTGIYLHYRDNVYGQGQVGDDSCPESATRRMRMPRAANGRPVVGFNNASIASLSFGFAWSPFNSKTVIRGVRAGA